MNCFSFKRLQNWIRDGSKNVHFFNEKLLREAHEANYELFRSIDLQKFDVKL
jgi:hypothetical protein